MEDLSLHVMDIVENSIHSGASEIGVSIEEIGPNDPRLVIVIEDNGRGMNKSEARKAAEPFYTSKEGKRVGLGLPLFKQSAIESGGGMTVESTPGRGTRVRAEFCLDHPDMKPLGDIEGTIALLRAFHPEVTFTLEIKYKGSSSRGGNDET